MSSISPDIGFNATSLDRLGDGVALDDLRQQGSTGPGATVDMAFDGAARGPVADPGEDVLNLPAWNGVPVGARQLAGDLAFEHRLAGLDLSLAADQGADAILDALV